MATIPTAPVIPPFGSKTMALAQQIKTIHAQLEKEGIILLQWGNHANQNQSRYDEEKQRPSIFDVAEIEMVLREILSEPICINSESPLTVKLVPVMVSSIAMNAILPLCDKWGLYTEYDARRLSGIYETSPNAFFNIKTNKDYDDLAH